MQKALRVILLSSVSGILIAFIALSACGRANTPRQAEPAGVADGRSIDTMTTAPMSAPPEVIAAPKQTNDGSLFAPSDTIAADPKQAPKIEIVRLGPFLPSDNAANDERNPVWWRNGSGGEWQALCQVQDAVQLVETRMQVSPSVVQDDKNGLLVTASPCCPTCPQAIVLIRGLPGSARVVPTARVTHHAVPDPRAQDNVWELDLLGKVARLHFQDAIGLPLMLTIGAQTQELRNWKAAVDLEAESDPDRHDFGFASGVEVLWAGDLNGDEQLDLLLKQGDAEIGTSVELYLSDGGSPMHLRVVDSFDLGSC